MLGFYTYFNRSAKDKPGIPDLAYPTWFIFISTYIWLSSEGSTPLFNLVTSFYLISCKIFSGICENIPESMRIVSD